MKRTPPKKRVIGNTYISIYLYMEYHFKMNCEGSDARRHGKKRRSVQFFFFLFYRASSPASTLVAYITMYTNVYILASLLSEFEFFHSFNCDSRRCLCVLLLLQNCPFFLLFQSVNSSVCLCVYFCISIREDILCSSFQLFFSSLSFFF